MWRIKDSAHSNAKLVNLVNLIKPIAYNLLPSLQPW